MGFARAETSKTDTAKAAAPKGSKAGVDKRALRGLDFDAGASALAPGGAAESGKAPGGEGAVVARAIAFNEKASWAKRGKNIRAVQGLLGKPVSGRWDAPTVEGVMGFQGAHGLAVDGQVGRHTRGALKAEMTGEARAKDEDGNEGADDRAQEAERPPVAAGKGKAPSAKAPEVQSPTQVAVAPGSLTPKQIVAAQAQHRERPFDPAWVALLQAALGAPPTGVLDSATIQKVAEFQTTAGTKATGVVNKDTLARLREAYPTLAESKNKERADLDVKGKKAGAETSADPIEDEAAQKSGFKSMNAYVATFVRGTFLGDSVTGHPNFIGRLGAAERALQVQFPGESGKDLGARLGSSVSNSYRPSEPGKPQAYHGLGHALDINKSTNPWVVGNPDAKKANAPTTKIIEHACDFMGQGAAFSPKDLAKWAEDLPTEELWAKIEQSNQSLIAYRQMAKDPAAIKAQFERRQAGKNPMKDERAELSYWLKKVPFHDKMLRGNKSNWKGNTKNLGFFDHSKVLISALRDAGGLAWGGVDLGERQSSDMMHFDNRNEGSASKLMKDVKAVRAKKGDKGAGKD